MRDTFLISDALLDGLDDMSPDECKALLLAIREYRAGREVPEISDRFMRLKISSAIDFIRNEDARYSDKCSRMAANRRGKTGSHNTPDVQEQTTITVPAVATDDPVNTQPKKELISDELGESIRSIWNSICGDTFGELRTITVKRKQKLTTRISEFGADADVTERFSSIFRRMADSKFCRQGARKWCTFDWIIDNDNNYTKVLEGRYDNPSNNNTTTHGTVTRFDRQQLSEQQLGAALAARCAQQMQREADQYSPTQ